MRSAAQVMCRDAVCLTGGSNLCSTWLDKLRILLNKTVARGPQDSSSYGKLATVKVVRGFGP